jgi:hypothetical protein
VLENRGNLKLIKKPQELSESILAPVLAVDIKP